MILHHTYHTEDATHVTLNRSNAVMKITMYILYITMPTVFHSYFKLVSHATHFYKQNTNVKILTSSYETF